MSDEIFFDGQRFISAAEASATADLSRDYVARLCRDGRVLGRRIGKNWYVHEDSLKHFLIEQEHAKGIRREQLSNERAQEYRHIRRSVHTSSGDVSAVPTVRVEQRDSTESIRRVDVPEVRSLPVTRTLAAHAQQVQEKLKTGVLARSEGAMRYAPSMLVTPSGVHEAVARTIGHGAMHVPAHALTPFAEFIQKFVALLVAFSMTFGTYAFVDPSYARFAANSIQETLSSVGDGYTKLTGGGTDALAQRSKEKMYFAAEHPSAALAQVSGAALAFIPDSLKNLARAINSGVDDLVYAVAFPQSVTGSTALTPYDGASVSVQVAPYARGVQNLAVSVPAASSVAQSNASSTVAPTPVTVIERQIQTERIVSTVGGISEDYLNQRLAALESTLSSRLLGSSSGSGGGGYTTINNNYSVIAASNNIDKLGSVTIDNSTFSGGTITGSAVDNATITGSSFAGSVSATTLSASATSSLATTTISGDLTVSGDTTISGTLSIPGALTISSSSISLLTNTYATTSFISAVTASTTNLTWVDATGTNATTTNFFSTIGRFTSAIIDSLTSYQSISGPSISATSTTATSTFAGGLLATRVPTLPHTFASWAVGAADSNLFDASFVINPASAVGDTNLFAAAVGGSIKFLVDAEGDVFVNNLTSVGSVTLSTTSASTFTVEGNATFGDSISDVTTVNGTLIVTGTTTASTIQGNFGIGTTTPWARLSVAGAAGGTSPLFTISSSTSGYATSSVFHIDSNGWVGIGTTSPAAKFAVDAPIYVGGAGVTATSTIEGNLHVVGNIKVGTNSSYISDSNISTVGSLTVTGTTTLTGLLSLTQASTTRLSVFDKAYFGGTATSTFDSAGNLFVAGTAGIGASSVDASAVFQIDSTSKGFLPPRMTTAQKNAIASAAAGLTVFDSSLNKLNVYNGAAWKNVGSTEIGGEVTDGTEGSVLFIGDGAVLGQDTSFTYSTSTSILSFASLRATASSTIGDGTQAGGLTISGGATTTGNAYFGGTIGVGTNNVISGNALTVSGGHLRIDNNKYITSANTSASQRNILGVDTSNYTRLFSADSGIQFYNGAQTTALMTIHNAGNVGIGSTTPFAKLSVEGAGTGTGVNFQTTNSNDTPLFTVLDNGNVGIATAAPTTPLEVKGGTNLYSVSNFTTAATARQLTIGEASNNSGYRLALGYFLQGGSTWTGAIQATAANVGTNLTLNPVGGNVGIGTTSPWAKLAISANNGETNTRLFDISSSTASATTSLFTVLNSGYVGIGTTSPYAQLAIVGNLVVSNGTIRFGDAATGLQETNSGATLRLDTQGTSRVIIDSSNTQFVTNIIPSADNVRNIGSVTNRWASLTVGTGNSSFAGNVGIGTTSPLSALNVYGTTGITWGGSGALSSGLVTVGTGGSAGGSLFVNTASFNDSTGFNSGLGVYGSFDSSDKKSTVNLTGYGVKASTYSSELALSTTNGSTVTEVMRLTGAGNVGIGTTSPASRLAIQESGTGVINFGQLSGSSAFSGIAFTAVNAAQVTTSNYSLLGEGTNTYLNAPTGGDIYFRIGNSTKMFLGSDGNVGIGTTSPWKMLSVAGDIIGTNITATGTLAVAGAATLSSTLDVTGDTTLANATTTNIFSTTASSTNLFSTSASFGSLSVLGALTQTGLGTFANGFVSQASSTVAGNFTSTGTVSFPTNGAATLGTDGTSYWNFATNRTFVGYNANTSNAFLQGGVGKGISFYTNNASAAPTVATVPALQITSGGNVGVATTTPWAKLAISLNNGETNTNAFIISSSTASATTTLFSVSSTGAVTGASSFVASTYYRGGNNVGQTWGANAAGAGGIGFGSGANKVNITPINGTAQTETSGTNAFLSVTPVYNQTSGTAANTDLLINRTQTAVGSGAQNLLDAQVDSVSMFSVSNIGSGYFAGNVGIGTTSPWKMLSVAGDIIGTNITATGTLAVAGASTFTGLATFSNNITANSGQVQIANTAGYFWNTRSNIKSPADGSIVLYNNASNDFGLLQFGGTTSAFPSIKRNGTDLDVRLADDSAYTGLTLGSLFATASSTIGDGTQTGGLTISGGATTTGNLVVLGSATSTFANGVSATYLNITGTAATSTFANGIQLTSGCFMLPDGECAGSSVTGTIGQLAYFSGTDTMVGTSTLYISTASNVGIGTSTPYAKLTVWGADTSNSTLSFLVADSASTTVFSVSNGGVFNFGKAATSTIKDNTAYAWTIATSSDASPLFNIDTTAGAEVVNIGHTSSDVIIGGVGYGSDLVFEENASIRGQGSGRTITLGANSDVLAFGTADLASCDLIYTDASGTISCGASDAALWTSSGDNIYRSTGSIGVGTTTPYYSLTIASSTGAQLALSDGTNNAWTFRNAGGNFYLATSTYSATSSTPAFTINSSGNVGIGTTTLDSTGCNGKFCVSGGVLNLDDGQALAWGGGTSRTSITGSKSGASLRFAGPSTLVSYFENGLLGVGTTSPWAKLSVSAADNASAPQFIVASSSASSFIVASTGNVGIGTTSPTSHNASAKTLHIDGGANASELRLTNTTSDSAASNGYLNSFTGTDAWLWNFESGILGFGTSNTERLRITSAGNVGIGTTTPFRMLSVTAAVATAQAALSYDTTRNTDFLTDSSGDLTINPSGDDVRLNDDNLWVCAGGACPTGTPSGNGNLIVETALGVGTSTPIWSLTASHATLPQLSLTDGSATSNAWTFRSSGNTLYIATSTYSATSTQPAITVTPNGFVGIGTTSPSQQLSASGLLFVGANGAAGMGTATSTFYGDIKIIGKLDVSTIDPVYTIDGIKYATYGHSTVGIKEEMMQLVYLARNESGMYSHTIDFDDLKEGSDMWLFYQITDFGMDWKNLVISLTPTFSGNVHYEKNAADNTLTIIGDMPGEVSMRLVGNRFDFSKWPNLRTDQDGDTRGTHIISTKPVPVGKNIVNTK